MISSADLGGLGDNEGAPVTYQWIPPSPLQPMLPWFGILILLAFAPNRTAKAWWIWAPLLAVTVGETAFRPLLSMIPSSLFALFCLAFNSLAFGTAAVWLLTPYLEHRLRFVVFLKVLGTIAAGTLLAYLIRADWEAPEEALGLLMVLAICVLVVSVGLALAGGLSRARYRPVSLAILLAALVLALWVLVASPFILLVLATSNGVEWWELTQVLLSFATLTYAVLFSFLLLAFANAFYRERLQALLHLNHTPNSLSPQLKDAEPAQEQTPAPAAEIQHH